MILGWNDTGMEVAEHFRELRRNHSQKSYRFTYAHLHSSVYIRTFALISVYMLSRTQTQSFSKVLFQVLLFTVTPYSSFFLTPDCDNVKNESQKYSLSCSSRWHGTLFSPQWHVTLLSTVTRHSVLSTVTRHSVLSKLRSTVTRHTVHPIAKYTGRLLLQHLFPSLVGLFCSLVGLFYDTISGRRRSGDRPRLVIMY